MCQKLRGKFKQSQKCSFDFLFSEPTHVSYGNRKKTVKNRSNLQPPL